MAFFCPMTRLWVEALREGRQQRCKFSFGCSHFAGHTVTYCVMYEAHFPLLMKLFIVCLWKDWIFFTVKPQLMHCLMLVHLKFPLIYSWVAANSIQHLIIRVEAVYSSCVNPYHFFKRLKWRFYVLQFWNNSAVIVDLLNDQKHFLAQMKRIVINTDITSFQAHSGCFLTNVHPAVTGAEGSGRYIHHSALMCKSETPARFYCLIWWCGKVITLQRP